MCESKDPLRHVLRPQILSERGNTNCEDTYNDLSAWLLDEI